MDPLLVQRTRYLLKSRFRRPQTCPLNLMPDACAQLLGWIEAHPLLAAHIHRLQTVETNAQVEVEDIFKIIRAEPFEAISRRYDATSFDAHAAICLRVVQAVAGMIGLSAHQQLTGCAGLAFYLLEEQVFALADAVEPIRDVALDGLFEYLDERLDSDSAIYAVLLKYKQRCEWFYNRRLRAYALEGLEGKTGERALAIDLYDYILGQGVDFNVEQASASGEVDLVLTSSDDRKLVIDAKYLSSETNRSTAVRKLAEGFHQVARYCNDYSEPAGFLVTFIATSKRISVELEQRDGLEFINIGGRSIYYLPIVISDEPSASKSGVAQEIQVSRAELVLQVEALEGAAPDPAIASSLK